MIRRAIRQFAFVGILIAVLALASPVQAAGWGEWPAGPGFFETAWNWLTRLWVPQEAASRGITGPAAPQKSGGIDPSGTQTTATTDPCQTTSCERGSDIDPNG